MGQYASVGYVDKLAIETGEKEYNKIKKADQKAKGFDLMNLELPKIFDEPVKEVKLLNKFGMVMISIL